MKIRSITYFYNVGWPIKEEKLQEAGLFLFTAKNEFEKAGFEVQTTRIASTPFPSILGADMIGLLPRFAQKLDGMLATHGIDYAALGPAMYDVPESYELITDALSVSKNIFFSGVIANKQDGISLRYARSTAKMIVDNSKIGKDGFANLRFTALANVPAGSPFFPAAYHNSDSPTFAIAVEAADLAVSAFDNAKDLNDGQQKLISEIEAVSLKLTAAADILKYRFNIRFGGIDFSLAPFPEDSISIGTAMEKMGVPMVGMHGSLAAAAFLASTLDQCEIPRVGFTGLMFPVLEDTTLAKNTTDGVLTVKDLLMYSAVCGSGLDTVPLPGDVSPDQIAAVLLDIAALSLRLNKPLTARLLPIPGKSAGEMTDFDFDYFVNGRIMALEAQPLKKLFAANEIFNVRARAELK
jgi:uncharacterized protein (UPF0210 family)